jgi:uncharacterized protein YjdB
MRLGHSRSANHAASLVLSVGLLLVAIAGCGGGSSGTDPLKVLKSISASPAQASVSVGTTEQFTATATYSDGSTQDVTQSATWSDANSKVATITSTGMATAVASGSTTVTAMMDGLSASATLTVPATPKTLASIAISPADPSLIAGSTQQFTATATYSDNSTADVTKTVSWTSSNPAVATISSTGLATAVAAGSVTIAASLDSIGGSAPLSVSAPARTLTSIALTPGSATIAIGATQQFLATANYSDGSTSNVTASATWSSSATTVATINPAGLATAVTAGSATITATLNGVSGRATLTVPPPAKTLSSITVLPATASSVAGATRQFSATANYSDGSNSDVTGTVTWISSNPAAATVSSTGLATAVAAGSATITASLNGIQGTAVLTVTPALTSISVSPNPIAIAAGATQQFTATAKYSDGSTQNVTATATWSSSNTAAATINSTGLATAVATGSVTITASFNGISGSATLNVNGITSISISPQPASFAMNATQQFTATATYTDGSTSNITSTATWSAANTMVATITSSGLATGVAAGSTTITASFDGTTGNLPITVTIPAGAGVNIPTWHVDTLRSGLNPGEVALTPANVAPKTFGKLFSYLVDGYAYAEPLLISNVTINGSAHNVLYVATENDSVYAFDADNYGTGAPLWKTSLLQSGERPAGGTVQPYQGITSTPVIDPSTNTIFVVSEQTSSTNGTTYRLNALNITTGAQQQAPVNITASVPGTNSTAVNGTVSLAPGCVQRAALLLSQGTIYIGIGSCHSGWLVSYSESTLTQTGVFNASPNIDGEGTYGGAGGVWMGSGGPVADSAGYIYISTGNGPWNPTQGSYGDSILKFSPTPVNGMLQLVDYFTPEDYGYMNCEDSDLASGGLLMIPGSGQVIGGGKMGRIYLVNTANMGHEQALDAGVVQRLFVEQGISGSQAYPSSCTDSDASGNPLPNGQTWYVGGPNDTNGDTTNGINSYEIFGTSAYFNGAIYLGVTPTTTTNPVGVVRRFTYTPGSSSATGQLAAEESSPLGLTQQQPENTRGTTPFISANGTSDGILWTIDQGQPLQTPAPGGPTNAVLYAYDATNLSNMLYGSDTNPGDQAGYGIKFTSPVVANGKVYISTGHDLTTVANPQGEIDVYGLK